MTETVHASKLAEFLLELGVFKQEDIQEAVQIAAQINLPLGRALILSNKMQEKELRAILQLQVLAKEETLDMETARKVFNLVKNDELSLSAALEKMGISTGKGPDQLQRSKLANLLIDAGLASQEQVDEALKVGYETGAPVGKMLAVSGVVSHAVLARALEIQVLLREGKMSYGQALEILRSESLRILPVEMTAEQRGLSKQDPSNKRVRLGELLMLSGVLTEGDMLNVLEMGLTTPKPLGDILKDSGLISEAVLEMALKLQDMISKGVLDIRAGAAALQELAITGKEVDPTECVFDNDKEIRLGDLLKQTGLVDNADIQEAIAWSSTYPAMIGKMLVVAGSIDEGTLLAALRCQFLMRNGALNDEEASQALLYAQRHRMSLDDALEELGIDIPAQLRRDG